MAAIDVGHTAAAYDNTGSAAYTYASKENPANLSGTIDTIEIWAASNMSGVEYAAFSASGDDMTINGHTDGSNLSVTAGSKVTHTAAGNDFTAFAISGGEYIGFYSGGGAIEADDSVGPVGNWFKSGDYVYTGVSGETFTWWSAYTVALYATGTEAGGAVAPTGALCGPLFGPLGGPI